MPRSRTVLRFLVAGLALASVLGGGGDLFQALDVFAHFRPQYAVIGLVLLLAAGRRKLRWTAGLGAAVVAGNAFLVLPYLPVTATGTVHAASGPGVTVATFNLLRSNRETSTVMPYLRQLEADVVVLQEVSPFWAGKLPRLREAYPFQAVETGADRGLAILSRRSWRAARVRTDPATGLQVATARVRVDGREVTVVGTHLIRPGFAVRRRQAAVLAQEVGRNAGPVVLLGDLNSTPWCAAFRRLEAAGLAPGPAGTPPTWPSWVAPVGLPIDHVLAGNGVTVTDKRRGPHLGSDHRPLVARLRLTD